MINVPGEARSAFEALGGNPNVVDAAFSVADRPGIEVAGVEVGRPIGETFHDTVVGDQISGTETVIGGGGRRPTASMRVVLDASAITAEHRAARLAELRAQRGE